MNTGYIGCTRDGQAEKPSRLAKHPEISQSTETDDHPWAGGMEEERILQSWGWGHPGEAGAERRCGCWRFAQRRAEIPWLVFLSHPPISHQCVSLARPSGKPLIRWPRKCSLQEEAPPQLHHCPTVTQS